LREVVTHTSREELHMLTSTKSSVALIATGALLALPATGGAAHKGAAHGKGKGESHSKRCAKTAKVGFSVGGTLVSFTADDAATAADEATVTLLVTSANRHARVSGELEDQDLQRPACRSRARRTPLPPRPTPSR
jgi:hypothetical protein